MNPLVQQALIRNRGVRGSTWTAPQILQWHPTTLDFLRFLDYGTVEALEEYASIIPLHHGRHA